MAEPRKAKEGVQALEVLCNEFRLAGWPILLRVRIRAEDGWAERGNQSDCLRDEVLVSSAIAIGGVEQKGGEAM